MNISPNFDSLEFFKNLSPIQQVDDKIIHNLEMTTLKEHLHELYNDFAKIDNVEELKNVSESITYLFLKKFLIAALKNPLESDTYNQEKCLKLACKIAHFSKHNLNSNPGYIFEENYLIERQIELLSEDNPETGIIFGIGTYGSDWLHIFNYVRRYPSEKKLHIYLIDPYNINFVYNPYHLFNQTKDWNIEVDSKINEILHFTQKNISITSIPSMFPFDSIHEKRPSDKLQLKIKELLQSHINSGGSIGFGCYFVQDGEPLKNFNAIVLQDLNVFDLYDSQRINYKTVLSYRNQIEKIESSFQLLTLNDKKINLDALISLMKKADWSDSQFTQPYKEDFDSYFDYFISFWHINHSFHFFPIEEKKANFLKNFVISPNDETKTFYLLKKFLGEIRSKGVKSPELRIKIKNAPWFESLSKYQTNSFLYKIYEEIKTILEKEDQDDKELKLRDEFRDQYVINIEPVKFTF